MMFNEKDLYRQVYRSKNDAELEGYCKLEGVSFMDLKKDIKKNAMSSSVIRFIKSLFK